MTLCSVTPAHRMTHCDLPAGLGPAVDDWVCDLDATTRSGKGVRSALFDAVYSASGGANPELRAATGQALELLHEAFLVHDDLADGDDHRRGALNLQGRTRARMASNGAGPETARHVGMVGGLLGGDVLLVSAVSGFARLSVPAPLLHRVLDEVERAVTASIVGEYADVHDSADIRPPGRERALAIGEAKTAAYTVILPVVLGALLAGAADETIESLREAGAHLGTAYQVIDDLLGVFGDPAVTGKSNTNDLVRRAPTILLAHAATTEAWPAIDAALGDPGDPGGDGPGDGGTWYDGVGPKPDPDTARELLRRCGARDHALRTAEDLVAAARAALDCPAVPGAVRAALEPHLETALERTR